MRLRTTLIGLLVVLTIVLSSTVYAGFALHKDALVSNQRADINETAETVATNLDTGLQSRCRLVKLAADSSALEAHGSDRQSTALRRFVEKANFDGGTVVARNGTVMAFSAADMNESERERVVGSDLSDRRYVQEALDGGAYVSEPFMADSGNYVVVVSAPIRRGDDDAIVGTLNAAFHLHSADPERQTLFADLTDLTGPSQSVSVTYEDETLYESRTLEGPTAIASRPVPGTEWTVVIHEDRTPIDSQLRDVTLLQGVALLVVLFSVATVGFWTYRTNIKQIGELRDGLMGLENGDYDAELALSGTEEWSEIGARFQRVGDRLEQRESQLRVLNRVLRHNLRNEMNVVRGHSQSLTDEDADVATHAAAIEEAAQKTLEISQHARMIEDRLREVEHTQAPSPLDGVVDDAIDGVEATDATISVDVPGDVDVVDGDAIGTALGELVENAIRHNPLAGENRAVEIAAEDLGDHVHITVADNGPGLPDVERQLLAGELEASPVDHGEGLGLWVSRWLVERADGTIDVAVTPNGTVFSLDVPTAYR